MPPINRKKRVRPQKRASADAGADPAGSTADSGTGAENSDVEDATPMPADSDSDENDEPQNAPPPRLDAKARKEQEKQDRVSARAFEAKMERRKKLVDARIAKAGPGGVPCETTDEYGNFLREEKKKILTAKLKAKRENRDYQGPEVGELIDTEDDDEELTVSTASTSQSKSKSKSRAPGGGGPSAPAPGGSSSSPVKETRPKRGQMWLHKEGAAEGEQGRSSGEKQGYGWKGQMCQILVIITVMVFLGILKAGEESFNEGDGPKRSSDEEDFYAVLDVPKSSTEAELKKSYKRLALRWHPDKNPNCEECLRKFQKIGRAYETLGDRTKRKLYDRTSAVDVESLPSAAEVITLKNYNHKVLSSNFVWVLQTYAENDSNCKSFHQHWEEVLTESSLAKMVKFGRIHYRNDQELLNQLPIAARRHPTVFLYTPSLSGETVPIFPASRATPAKLQKWISANTPESAISRVYSKNDLDLFLAAGGAIANTEVKTKSSGGTNRLKLLIVTTGSSASSFSKPLPLSLKKSSIQWNSIFDFAVVRAEDVRENVGLLRALTKFAREVTDENVHLPEGAGEQFQMEKPSVLVFDGSSCVKVVNFPSSMVTDELLVRALYSLQAELVMPFLTTSNAEMLCRSNSQYRIYCLVEIVGAVDDKDGRVLREEKDAAELQKTLAQARGEYLVELFGEGGDGGTSSMDANSRVALANDIFGKTKKAKAAKQAATGRKKGGVGGAVEPEDVEASTDNDSSAQLDDIFFVQRARLNVAPDSLSDWVAHRPPRAKFALNAVLEAQKEMASSSGRWPDYLLLDLDGRRVKFLTDYVVRDLYAQLEQDSVMWSDFSDVNFAFDHSTLFAPGISLFQDVRESLRHLSNFTLFALFAGFFAVYSLSHALGNGRGRMDRPKLGLLLLVADVVVLLFCMSPATRFGFFDFVFTWQRAAHEIWVTKLWGALLMVTGGGGGEEL